MRRNFQLLAIFGLGSVLLGAGPALADSGQLRDPTRCGQGGANCRNLPPSASDRIRDTPRNERAPRVKTDDSPLMRTSPLPSEGLQRPIAPSSTGLDKGSTGLSNKPARVRSIAH